MKILKQILKRLKKSKLTEGMVTITHPGTYRIKIADGIITGVERVR